MKPDDVAAFLEIEQFFIDEHHGPDLADVALEDIAGDAVLDDGQLQAEEAIEQLEVVLYAMMQFVDEGFDLCISFGELVFLVLQASVADGEGFGAFFDASFEDGVLVLLEAVELFEGRLFGEFVLAHLFFQSHSEEQEDGERVFRAPDGLEPPLPPGQLRLLVTVLAAEPGLAPVWNWQRNGVPECRGGVAPKAA